MESRSVDVSGFRVLVQILPVVKTLSITRLPGRQFFVITEREAENAVYHILFDGQD